METIRTVADMYFDVCSAAGHKYAGVTLSPGEYGHLLAHSHASIARAERQAAMAQIDIESREITRAISEAARKSTRALIRAQGIANCADACDASADASHELAIFLSTFRANITRIASHASAQFAMIIGCLVEEAIARKQLSFASIAKCASA